MGMIYDRVDSLHHKDDEFRAEWRSTRPPRGQLDKMEHLLCLFPFPALPLPPPFSGMLTDAAKRLST